MGFASLSRYIVSFLVFYGIYLAFAPNLLNINPNYKSVKIFKECVGPLKPNERLSQAEKLLENEVVGPESLVMHKGILYTGIGNGDIIALSNDKKKTILANLAPTSRPLGLRLYKGNKLLAVDARNGLYSVDIKTGKGELLLSSDSPIDGKPMKLPDDVTFDKDGIIYISDASARWNFDQIIYSFLEHDKTGRVISFDPKNGKTSVLVENLAFPNGVQISHDGKSLLISETFENRILKLHLEGKKKGTTEIFAELPGLPDNIRPSSRGGYWVALDNVMNETSIGLLERSTQHPMVRKIVARFFHTTGSIMEKINSFLPNPLLAKIANNVKNAHFLLENVGNHCAIIELDVNGNIIQSLQSSDTSYCHASEVLEDNGHLYVGSYINPYIFKIKL